MENQGIKQSIMLEISPEQLLTLMEERIEAILEKHHAKTKEVKYYDKKQAAEKLRVGLTSIYNWLNEGKLKGRKIGSRVLFTESDLENCFEEWSKYGRLQK